MSIAVDLARFSRQQPADVDADAFARWLHDIAAVPRDDSGRTYDAERGGTAIELWVQRSSTAGQPPNSDTSVAYVHVVLRRGGAELAAMLWSLYSCTDICVLHPMPVIASRFSGIDELPRPLQDDASAATDEAEFESRVRRHLGTRASYVRHVLDAERTPGRDGRSGLDAAKEGKR